MMPSLTFDPIDAQQPDKASYRVSTWAGDRQRSAFTTFVALLFANLLLLSLATLVVAQPPKKKGLGLGNLADIPEAESAGPPSGLTGGLSAPLMNGAAADTPITYSAEYSLAENGKSGELRVTGTLGGTWHTYSTTQPPGGPKPTVITADKQLVKLKGLGSSNQPPKVSENEVYPGVPIEEHAERVVWTIPFDVVGDLAGGKTELSVSIDALVCADPPLGECRPIEQTIKARFVSTQAEPIVEAHRAKFSHADVKVHVEPAEIRPGGEANVVVTFEVDDTYHIYLHEPGSSETTNRTLIVPLDKGGLEWGKPATTSKSHKESAAGIEVEFYKDKTVKWHIPVRAPKTASEGVHEVKLGLGFQTCTDSNCDPPVAVVATGALKVVSAPGSAATAGFSVTDTKKGEITGHPQLASWYDFESDAKRSGEGGSTKSAATPAADVTGGLTVGSLSLRTLLSALLGGFILNFMPCVLPVIGLKVLGFVEQAGSSRAEVVKLNVAYVLGICVVMWVLAGITVATKNAFGWGQQFTVFEFKLAMAALVFAMALSFLGVWEIPIPGFATSYKSNQLMEREGMVGAFSKGLLTTILATPCSGPLLGFVFAVTLTLDPAGVFVVYTMVGLGMGLPFLVLCLRPSAVKLLPKPGPWMETLKEGLAFPLLLTVVYFVASIHQDYRIATFSTLIAVWFGCWLIGKVPIYADKHVKVKAWSFALATMALWGMLSFYLLGPSKTDMPWQDFSAAKLASLRNSGKTVMIDFTANWCYNCKMNTLLAIEVPSVINVVKKNDVAPLLADKTDPSPEIEEQIRALGGNAIPLLAIYPSDPNADPIVLNGTFTAKDLVNALEKAGPSRPGGKMTKFE